MARYDISKRDSQRHLQWVVGTIDHVEMEGKIRYQ